MKNDPRILRAWCFYDWANSVHALVIVSSIFPVYFAATALNAQGGPVIDFLGMRVKNSVLFSYTISAAFLLTALLSPICTAIADYTGRKKAFMRFFCYLGSASCALLYFFTRDTTTWAVICFGVSLVGWGGSIVFYNSYLPDIATPDRFDSVSARGFSLGFLGSVLLMVFNLTMILMPAWYGNISSGMASRLSFLTVGLWWFGFAQITFRALPGPRSVGPRSVGPRSVGPRSVGPRSVGPRSVGPRSVGPRSVGPRSVGPRSVGPRSVGPRSVGPRSAQGVRKTGNMNNWLLNGFRELRLVWREMSQQPLLRRFLPAFFLYSMGLQTVMYVATLFGSVELKLPDASLIATILVIQLVAIPGAYGFAWLSTRLGNTYALMVAVVIWIGICVGAYLTRTPYQFYALAAVVGLVMGGIQSLSRSTYAKFIPADTVDTASYFSFYDVAEKLSIVLGTAMYGLIEQLTGSMRNSVLALLVLFLMGLWFLSRIPSQKVYGGRLQEAEVS